MCGDWTTVYGGYVFVRTTVYFSVVCTVEWKLQTHLCDLKKQKILFIIFMFIPAQVQVSLNVCYSILMAIGIK
jgi:hypothetical protein